MRTSCLLDEVDEEDEVLTIRKYAVQKIVVLSQNLVKISFDDHVWQARGERRAENRVILRVTN